MWVENPMVMNIEKPLNVYQRLAQQERLAEYHNDRFGQILGKVEQKEDKWSFLKFDQNVGGKR